MLHGKLVEQFLVVRQLLDVGAGNRLGWFLGGQSVFNLGNPRGHFSMTNIAITEHFNIQLA
ncbi:DNA-directed RNA polymerase beta subunit [gamma proteobacterium IMCC2047]|nr:DNA-directed RNA polymerase beta subunit [gamma proteobacterium IMCC2047]